MNEAVRPGAAKTFIKRLAPIIKGEGPEHKFGWGIDTSNEYLVAENAAEDGTPTDAAFWEAISQDSMRLEGNVLRIMRHTGMGLRDEGHSESELVGSGWLREGGTAWRIWEDIDDDEVLRVDDLSRLFPDADSWLWHGISEHGKRYLECHFRFFDPWPDSSRQLENKRPSARAVLDRC